MPVAALGEKGLVLDVFGEDGIVFECDRYALEADRICWIVGEQVKYYDLKEKRMIVELEIEEPREVKMAPNGKCTGILTSRNEMIVFDRDGIRLRRRDIFKFRISNSLLAYASQSSFCIHRIEANEIVDTPFHTSKVSVFEFFASDEFVFLATKRLEKDGRHKILRISEGSVEVLHSLETFQGFSMKVHPSEKYMLLLLTTAYVNDSYFPESDLYLHDVGKNEFKKLDLTTIHWYTFISNGFSVCHGAQPSSVSVYDLDCNLSFDFPRGTRNRIFFNQHENIVVFSGFDNLSGDIEVFDVASRKLISKFNVLGASLVNWKENGSYFYVSTTSYFQEDNKITVYDYYGRVVDEKLFECLSCVGTYGDTEEFVRLERPNDLVIEMQKKYIPPSLRGLAGKGSTDSKANERRVPVNAKPREKSKEEVLDALKEIQVLKERMRTGKELSVEELNLMLKEAKLNSELRKLE